jgi:hypothetical protein
MKALDLLLQLHAMCHFRSTEGQAVLSKSELKRWCDKGSVIVNSEKVKWDEEMDFPIFSFILHPKGDLRCTLL